jgi:hypothetical protein
MPSIDRRLHLAADCSLDGASADFDLAAFLERLLLFERYTVRTHMCREVDAMIAHLGVVETTKLIESDVVRIHDGAAVIGAWNLEKAQPFQYDLGPTLEAGASGRAWLHH